ncbi:MAG: acyl-CoA dehydrogenase [Streptosporangiales bacterium]|nr:acyl-CoA dehydrogenase [Streptosporangiales bacterium]
MTTSFGSPEARAFRERLRTWLAGNVPEAWRRAGGEDLTDDEVVEVRREWDRRLFAAGYAGVTWPVEFGGRGFGPVEEYVFYEECARAGAPEGLGRVGRLLAGPTLIAHGTDEQRARYLRPILSGEEIWCQGFSEPGAGSDLAAVRTRAGRDGAVYRVSGQKTWTSFAHYADWCLLLALTGPAELRHRNLSMLIVDMHAPGVTVRPIRQISGRSEFNEVFFDDVEVPVANRIGAEDDGWRVAMTVLTNERGMAEAANRYVDLMADSRQLLECAGHRPSRIGGDTLGGVEVYADRVEALRWQVMRAVEKSARGGDWFPSMAVLKLYWSELMQDMASAGLGLGCAEHASWWRRRYLESRATTIYSGTSEIQRNIIAERVLGLPK